jgi:hypothetical protein
MSFLHLIICLHKAQTELEELSVCLNVCCCGLFPKVVDRFHGNLSLYIHNKSFGTNLISVYKKIKLSL